MRVRIIPKGSFKDRWKSLWHVEPKIGSKVFKIVKVSGFYETIEYTYTGKREPGDVFIPMYYLEKHFERSVIDG